MSVSGQPNNNRAAMVEDVSLSSDWSGVCSEQQRIADPAETNPCMSPQLRMDKVLSIRRQLAEQTYDIEKRLDAALDRLIKTFGDNDICGTGHDKRR